jgi:hypothetical protein
MKNYSIKAIEEFINNYCVDCLFESDSVIGLGNRIYLMKNGRYFIIKEFFINSWASGHNVRQVSKLSKKMLTLIESKENLLNQD